MQLTNILGDGIASMEVIQQVGNDKMVVNAARVSFAQDGMEDMLTFKDKRLIRFLVNNRHGSPLEHNLLTVKVRLPMPIGEQWLRHRAGWSYNKESGRYIDLSEPEFYIPVEFRRQGATNRQASQEGQFDAEMNRRFRVQFDRVIEEAVSAYRYLLDSGVAKEQARMILPLGLYMSMYVTCNLRSLMHFVELRNHADAQWEMQQYAKGMLQIAKQYWPESITAMEEAHELHT